MFSSNSSQVSQDAVFVEDIFSTYLYTGNGSSQTIANGIDLTTYGGMVWIKDRTNAYNHVLTDTVRGATSQLYSNLTNAATTSSVYLSAFTSSGFSVGNSAPTNTSSANDVSWTFRKQPKFFDVVTYSGNAAVGRAISHSLGSTPGCVIVKRTNNVGDWFVYHRNLTAGNNLYLNQTVAQQSSAVGVTGVSSTTFTVGDAQEWGNESGANYVAYLFAHDAGGFGLTGADNVISCGSYTGTGSAGINVNLGYEPQWVLIKNASGAYSWFLFDTMRGMDNTTSNYLFPNTSSAENTNTPAYVIPTATGFTVNATGPALNNSGNTFIYIAIRRGPMKTPTSGTQVFTPRLHTGTASTTSVTGLNHNVDYMMAKGRNSANQSWVMHLTRLMGLRRFPGSTTNAQSFDSVGLDRSNGYNLTNDSSYEAVNGTYWGSSYVHWLWSRAPGFLDVVSYVGTGANLSVTHNLGAVPRMMIIKSDSTGPHSVYHHSRGNTKRLRFTSTGSEETSSGYWNNTTPTSTTFTVGTDAEVNTSGQRYWAYLFGEIPGISKIGTYTGNGSSQTIDCGFTGGARFVLLKEVGTAYWYLFDSARGIVAGNDPYLYPSGATPDNNDGAADLVDPVSSGFIVNTVAGFNTNDNSATYIYYAIA